MWPLFHFVRPELEANGGVFGGVSHKFNAIRHGRETAEIGLSPETAEIVCFDLGAAHAPRLILSFQVMFNVLEDSNNRKWKINFFSRVTKP